MTTEPRPAHNHEHGSPGAWIWCTPACPAWVTAMCECSHHWSVHRESGQTAKTDICHGYTGSATPGPYEPCRCTGFRQWSGPTDSRTGEPVRPLTMATRPQPLQPGEAVMWSDSPAIDRLAAIVAGLEGYVERRAAELAGPMAAAAQRDHAAEMAILGERHANERGRAARAEDLVAELRKQLATRDRQLAQAKAESRQNAEIAAAALDRQAADGT